MMASRKPPINWDSKKEAGEVACRKALPAKSLNRRQKTPKTRPADHRAIDFA
jgi:hypothetical protein